jgi:hypothetical protein
MTAEQLRDAYVRDIDDALDSWVLMRRLSEEQKRRLRAQRAFLMAADAPTLAALLASYEREPARASKDAELDVTIHAHYRRKGNDDFGQVYALIDLAWDRGKDSNGTLMVILYIVVKPSSYIGGETVCMSQDEFVRDFEEIPAYPPKPVGADEDNPMHKSVSIEDVLPPETKDGGAK